MTLALPPRRPQRGIDAALAIVNIVLLLIFFFLLSGQTPPPASDVSLSLTRHMPHEKLPDPLLVIAPQGAWMLDGQPITPELLPLALAQAGPDAGLFLMMDRDAPASQLLAIINHPALADRQVQLVTLREEAGP